MTTWLKVLDARTPAWALPEIVEQETDRALDQLRATLAADAAVTDDERAVLIAKARPLVLARVRAEIEGAWQRLQLEGQSVH